MFHSFATSIISFGKIICLIQNVTNEKDVSRPLDDPLLKLFSFLACLL